MFHLSLSLTALVNVTIFCRAANVDDAGSSGAIIAGICVSSALSHRCYCCHYICYVLNSLVVSLPFLF